MRFRIFGDPNFARSCKLQGADQSPLFSSGDGITGLTESAVLPVIGTKELIAWLPVVLGCGPGDVVVYPTLAYPTYDVGARLAGRVWRFVRALELWSVSRRASRGDHL